MLFYDFFAGMICFISYSHLEMNSHFYFRKTKFFKKCNNEDF